jgi:hypothetical protein
MDDKRAEETKNEFLRDAATPRKKSAWKEGREKGRSALRLSQHRDGVKREAPFFFFFFECSGRGLSCIYRVEVEKHSKQANKTITSRRKASGDTHATASIASKVGGQSDLLLSMYFSSEVGCHYLLEQQKEKKNVSESVRREELKSGRKRQRECCDE